MSALASSTLVIVLFCVAAVLAWWRTLLKLVAVGVLVLTCVGTAEVVAAVLAGLRS